VFPEACAVLLRGLGLWCLFEGANSCLLLLLNACMTVQQHRLLPLLMRVLGCCDNSYTFAHPIPIGCSIQGIRSVSMHHILLCLLCSIPATHPPTDITHTPFMALLECISPSEQPLSIVVRCFATVWLLLGVGVAAAVQQCCCSLENGLCRLWIFTVCEVLL
jgi:hypothetical protein